MTRLLTRASVVTVAVVCVAVGFSIAWSSLAGSATAPAYANKADFNRAFADAAAGHREFRPADVEKLRDAGRRSIDAP
jgi:hypothetical protein